MLFNDLQWTLLVFAPILIYWCENPGYMTASTDTVWCVSHIFKYISDLAILAIHYLVHLRNIFLRMVRFTMQTTLSLSSVFLYILFFYDVLSIIYFCVLSGAIHSFCFHLSFCLSFFRPFLFFLFYILSCWPSFPLLLFQCLFQFIYFFHLDFFFVLTLLISIPNSSDIVIFWQKVMTQLFFFYYCLFIDCSVFLSSLLFWILWYINIAYCTLPDMSSFPSTTLYMMLLLRVEIPASNVFPVFFQVL